MKFKHLVEDVIAIQMTQLKKAEEKSNCAHSKRGVGGHSQIRHKILCSAIHNYILNYNR